MKQLGRCKICKKKNARVLFSTEPILTLTHGFGGTPLCRKCYINIIEDELKEINKNLNLQKRLLKKGK